MISFDGKYLMVEDKLDIHAEQNLEVQVARYCRVDSCILDAKSGKIIEGDKFYTDNVLIIDTEKIYMYYVNSNIVDEIFELDDLKQIHDVNHIKILIKQRLQ